jgi:uncharacterized membrane protein
VAAVRRASLEPVDPLTTWDSRGSVGTAIDGGALAGELAALIGLAPVAGEALATGAGADAAMPQVLQ